MACMPMEAFAEATPSEAEATQTPDAAETPENTETPEETPTPAPDQGPEATLLPQETPRPVETQLPEPEETEDWKPWGQAWAELADGTHAAGSLTEVLAWLEKRAGRGRKCDCLYPRFGRNHGGKCCAAAVSNA